MVSGFKVGKGLFVILLMGFLVLGMVGGVVGEEVEFDLYDINTWEKDPQGVVDAWESDPRAIQTWEDATPEVRKKFFLEDIKDDDVRKKLTDNWRMQGKADEYLSGFWGAEIEGVDDAKEVKYEEGNIVLKGEGEEGVGHKIPKDVTGFKKIRFHKMEKGGEGFAIGYSLEEGGLVLARGFLANNEGENTWDVMDDKGNLIGTAVFGENAKNPIVYLGKPANVEKTEFEDGIYVWGSKTGDISFTSADGVTIKPSLNDIAAHGEEADGGRRAGFIIDDVGELFVARGVVEKKGYDGVSAEIVGSNSVKVLFGVETDVETVVLNAHEKESGEFVNLIKAKDVAGDEFGDLKDEDVVFQGALRYGVIKNEEGRLLDIGENGEFIILKNDKGENKIVSDNFNKFVDRSSKASYTGKDEAKRISDSELDNAVDKGAEESEEVAKKKIESVKQDMTQNLNPPADYICDGENCYPNPSIQLNSFLLPDSGTSSSASSNTLTIGESSYTPGKNPSAYEKIDSVAVNSIKSYANNNKVIIVAGRLNCPNCQNYARSNTDPDVTIIKINYDDTTSRGLLNGLGWKRSQPNQRLLPYIYASN